MDDISDILNDVSRDPFAEYDATYASIDRGRLHSGQADLQALTRAWINERGTTELLPYESPPCVLSKNRPSPQAA
jgi:GINS complex subunit 4